MTGLPDYLRRPVRGMRDWLPQQYYALKKIEEILSNVAESFGYRRVETPVVEHFEVLSLKAGQDVINEIYYFKDKGGRDLGLRFDMTVPLARVVSYHLDAPRPIRWYYFTKVFRYDEPQHGRYREFYQFGVELMGSQSPRADAEVLQLVAQCLEEAGLHVFDIKLNDRRVVDAYLNSIGAAENRHAVYRALDKKLKLPREEVVSLMVNSGVYKEVAEKIYDDTVETTLEEAVLKIEKIDSALGTFYRKLLNYLKDVDLSKFKFDMSIVRGLDYYTGMVFEAFAGDYKLAVGGGGRYDDLLEQYSGVKIPALGFAIGVERLMETLSLQEVERPLDYYIYIFDDDAYHYAYTIAKKLRKLGHSVVIELGDKHIKEAFEYMLKIGTKKLIIIGKRELERGVVKVKDLERREEIEMSLSELIS
ncbi:MAG: histidine--tRNA ligase [Pyrobaculum sp.]